MARGQEAKLRRRANRKNKDDEEGPIDMFGQDDNDDDDAIPLPPSMGKTKAPVIDADSSDDGLDDMPKKSKKKKSKKTVRPPGVPPPTSDAGGIKKGPLIMLLMMFGTAVIPAMIYASDFLGKFVAQNNVIGQVGFRMGIGAVPRKRVMSFYEKHAPEKLEEVPKILASHYGDYPKLVKKLERKYQDYGYFIGWEEDEAPLTLALDNFKGLYDTWLEQYWNVYAPQPLKTAFRNIRYNLNTLRKKFRKVWKKTVWPALEPFFGVPKGVEKQKREDAKAARDARKKTTGTKRKNTDFRDEEEE